jgi:hypothetical protein
MSGLLEAFGQGLSGAGAILSEHVYDAQAKERAETLPNLLRALEIKKAMSALQADQDYAAAIKEASAGMQPSAMSTSAGMLDLHSKIPMDVLARSPVAHQTFEMIGKQQAREQAVQARQDAITARRDALEQRANEQLDKMEQRKYEFESKAADKAASDLDRAEARAEALRLQQQIANAHIELRRQGLDLQREAKADRDQRREDALLTPEEARFMAKQAWTGDTSVMQNVGRGAQGGENIVRLRRAIMELGRETGKTPEELAAKNAEFFGIKAGERTLGTRTANIEMAVTEAQNIIPIALRASEKVDRTKYPNLNSVILAYEKKTGDENVVNLAVATNALINVYSRAIAPSGTPTVHDKEHAREIIAAAYSKGQYKSVVDIMQQEMAAARKSPEQVRGSMRESVTGKASANVLKFDAQGNLIK